MVDPRLVERRLLAIRQQILQLYDEAVAAHDAPARQLALELQLQIRVPLERRGVVVVPERPR